MAKILVVDDETDIRDGSERILKPRSTTRIDESMSSVSIDPRIRVSCSNSVRQKPFDPPNTPNRCIFARPGCATE